MSRATVVALVLAPLLLLTGCGSQRTGHGAPPYQPYPKPAKGPTVRTTFPGERIRFEIPRLGVEDRLPILAFIGFERALVWSERNGRAASDLHRFAYPKMTKLLESALASRAGQGLPAPGRTTVTVTHLTTTPTLVALRSCQASGSFRSGANVLIGVRHEAWKVAAVRQIPARQAC